jgi:hypothetical protein
MAALREVEDSETRLFAPLEAGFLSLDRLTMAALRGVEDSETRLLQPGFFTPASPPPYPFG